MIRLWLLGVDPVMCKPLWCASRDLNKGSITSRDLNKGLFKNCEIRDFDLGRIQAPLEQ